jgi:hypothetical protein
LIVCRSATIVDTFWIRDLNASCVSCVVVAMAMRIGREGGTMMAQATAMEGGSEYQVVMVLDRPAVGTCLRRARRD